jgi:hypothetical protein
MPGQHDARFTQVPTREQLEEKYNRTVQEFKALKAKPPLPAHRMDATSPKLDRGPAKTDLHSPRAGLCTPLAQDAEVEAWLKGDSKSNGL